MGINGGGALMGVAHGYGQGGYTESRGGPGSPYSTVLDQCGTLPVPSFGMIHTRKSKAWAVWRARAWKNLDRVAIKARQ